ncbi:MAG: elongation factor G [Actinobacteria bacterium]|nr:elongation factor G [Actinomycetota bacterium]
MKRSHPALILALSTSITLPYRRLPWPLTVGVSGELLMKSYATENIRNVVLVGHGGSGKTSLAEALLFLSGATTRLGTVEEGNTVTDFDDEEHRRQISVSTALAPLEWGDCKINVLDAPGYADFIGELRSAMRVADLAVFVVSAVEGIEVQTQVAWNYAEELGLPRMIFVNKLERENASFRRTLEQLRETFGKGCAPLSLPLGREHNFSGIISVLDQEAFAYDQRGKHLEQEIPEDRQARVDEVRTDLLDSVAETDDALLERYLEGGEITRNEIVKALHEGIDEATIFPVFCGAATKLIGVDRLADVIVAAGPSPLDRPPIETEDGKTREAKSDGPMSALVFKTTTDPYVGRISFFRVFSGKVTNEGQIHNSSRKADERVAGVFTMRGKTQENVNELVAGDIGAIAKLNHTLSGDTLSDKNDPVVLPPIEPPESLLPKAIEPKTKGDEDKLMIGLHKLIEEDPSVKLERSDETHQTILWGMGDAHLDVVLHHLKDKFSVEVEEVPFIVPYRTSLGGKAEAIGRHVKQSGGHGQYGICNIRVEPLPRGSGFVYEDKIFGGSIPNQWIPSVEKGIRAEMEKGLGTGYTMIDIKVELYDGKFHTVDSSDMAFQLAGSAAIKDAAQKAGFSLLEPIWELDVMVPEAFTGDIMGDLQKRRGIPEGIETVGGGRQIVKAKVPFGEVTHYATDLRSMTGGQGTFSWNFSHYQEVPHDLAQKVLERAGKDDA